MHFSTYTADSTTLNSATKDELIRNSTHYRESPRFKAQHYVLSQLPQVVPSEINLDDNCPQMGRANDLSPDQTQKLREIIRFFPLWRTGPYRLFDISIEADWKSYVKWDYFSSILSDIEGKSVADIGANNGYYMLRLLGKNPSQVVGFDPYVNFFFTFSIFQTYLKSPRLHYLSLGFEHLHHFEAHYDIALLWGLLYHHPDPVYLLKQATACLKPGGDLLIETAMIDDGLPYPTAVYGGVDARSKGDGSTMYWIPNQACLQSWVEQVPDLTGLEIIGVDAPFHGHLLSDHPLEQAKKQSIYPKYYEQIDPAKPTQLKTGMPIEKRLYARVQKKPSA